MLWVFQLAIVTKVVTIRSPAHKQHSQAPVIIAHVLELIPVPFYPALKSKMGA